MSDFCAQACVTEWQRGFVDGLACAVFIVLLLVSFGLGLALTELGRSDGGKP